MHLLPSVKSLHILALSFISSFATLLPQVFVRKIYLSGNQDSPEVVEGKSKFINFWFSPLWLDLNSQCKEDQEWFFQAQRDFITRNQEYDLVFLRLRNWKQFPEYCQGAEDITKMGRRKKGSMLRLVLGHLPRIPHPLSPSKEPKLAAQCQGPQQHLPGQRWHQRTQEFSLLHQALQWTRALDKSSFLKLYKDVVTPFSM